MTPRSAFELGLIRTDRGQFLDKGNQVVDVTHPDFGNSGARGDGVTDDALAFADADAYALSTGPRLYVPTGTYLIGSNITVGSPIEFAYGAVIKPTAGVTVTFAGYVYAGPSQVFDLSASGSSVVTGSAANEVNPLWFGAVGDGVADDTPSLQAALDSVASAHGLVRVPANVTLRITSEVTGGAVRLVGVSRDTSRIFVDFDGVGVELDGDSVSTCEVRDLSFTGELVFTWTLSSLTSQVGLKISTTHNPTVSNCAFTHLYEGVQLEGAGYYPLVEHNLFRTCLVGVRTLELASDGPSEASIVFNQFDMFPAGVGGPGETVGIQLDAGSGFKVWGNGLENCGVGIAIQGAQFVSLFGNRYEDNTVNVTTTDPSVLTNMMIGGFDDTQGSRVFIGSRLSAEGVLNLPGDIETLGGVRAGLSADLNVTTAENGTGGGNRQFDGSFTGASATGFVGTDSVDQGHGYFPVTIKAGRRYRVSATLAVVNGSMLSFFTASSKDFATGTVDTVEAAVLPVSDAVYEFTATADAAYFGIGASRASGTMSLTVSNFSIKRMGLVDVDADGNLVVDKVFRTPTVTTLDDTGTPSVAGGNLFKTGGTTTITDFDDGVIGQTITILSAHAITITDGSNILLNGSTNFVLAAGDTLTLTMFNDQVWEETSRKVN